MREFIDNEIEDVERRMCELVEEYDDNWEDRYYEEIPNALLHSSEVEANTDREQYYYLKGERDAFIKVKDYLTETYHPEFVNKDGNPK